MRLAREQQQGDPALGGEEVGMASEQGFACAWPTSAVRALHCGAGERRHRAGGRELGLGRSTGHWRESRWAVCAALSPRLGPYTGPRAEGRGSVSKGEQPIAPERAEPRARSSLEKDLKVLLVERG